MNFKEMIQFDIDGVFLNLEEFGEIIELDGRQMQAVVIPEEIELRSEDDDRRAVVYDNRTIYINRNMVDDKKYYPEKRVIFNGVDWRVYNCTYDDVVTLILYKERS